MKPSVYDTCFMYTEKCLVSASLSSNLAREVLCIQTEYTVYSCNKDFSDAEERLSKEFDCRKAKYLEYGTSIKVNGAIISRRDRTYMLT